MCLYKYIYKYIYRYKKFAVKVHVCTCICTCTCTCTCAQSNSRLLILHWGTTPPAVGKQWAFCEVGNGEPQQATIAQERAANQRKFAARMGRGGGEGIHTRCVIRG